MTEKININEFYAEMMRDYEIEIAFGNNYGKYDGTGYENRCKLETA